MIAPGYEPEALEILKAEEERQLQCDPDRSGLCTGSDWNTKMYLVLHLSREEMS